MSCTKPLRIRNPRYLPSKKNGGFAQHCDEPRLKWLTVPCGKCHACRKRRANDWRFRLHQEYMTSDSKRFHFVTFTFSDESLEHLRSEWIRLKNTIPDDNDLVRLAVRRFLERYRKMYKVSLRHFFITELGENTERIHLHGMIVNCKCGYWKRNKYYADFDTLSDLWSYGHVWLGWCNEKTISYICKYITKFNDENPEFTPIVLTSPGFGKGYVTSFTIRLHRNADNGNGMWYVTSSNGYRMAIPRYLRLKLFSEEILLARQIALLDNPPPRILKGIEYPDEIAYKKALYREHLRSISLKLTIEKPYVPNNRDIEPNENFY